MTWRVLILEDDASTGMLLRALATRLWPEGTIAWFQDSDSACVHWREHGADLAIVDLQLPGIGGEALLDEIRRTESEETLRVIISANADRDAVLMGRRQGVHDFIVKPFRVREVIDRLRNLVDGRPAAGAAPAQPAADGTIEAFIKQAIKQRALSLPLDRVLAERLETLSVEGTLDTRTLVKLIQFEPALVGRLHGIANTSPYNDGSQLVESLPEAIERLGARVVADVAATLALQPGSDISAEPLASRLESLRADTRRLVEQLTELSRTVLVDRAACHAAAMFFRSGELALLQLLQLWLGHGHELSEEAIERLMARHTAELGFQLQMQWQIPLRLRQRIGAATLLPEGTVRSDHLAMRIAALTIDAPNSAELTLLRQRLGL